MKQISNRTLPPLHSELHFLFSLKKMHIRNGGCIAFGFSESSVEGADIEVGRAEEPCTGNLLSSMFLLLRPTAGRPPSCT